MNKIKLIAASIMIISFLGLAGCGNTTESTNPISNSSSKTQTTAPATTQPVVKETQDAKSIVDALKSSGQPITKVDIYTESNDPNKLLGRPGQYTSKVNFVDTRVKEDVTNSVEVTNGGSIEVFDNSPDAKNRFDYVSKIAKSSPMFNEYDFLDGKIVMRISNDLTPTQEKQYETALTKILK